MSRLRRAKSIERAKKILAGSYGERTAAPLKPGQVRCALCGRGTTLTPNGKLRAHRDADGVACPHRPQGFEPSGTFVAPPVVLPTPHGERFLPATGRCHECDKPITGERRYCGRCLARRL